MYVCVHSKEESDREREDEDDEEVMERENKYPQFESLYSISNQYVCTHNTQRRSNNSIYLSVGIYRYADICLYQMLY